MAEWAFLFITIIILCIGFYLYCKIFYKTGLFQQFGLRYDFERILKEELGENYKVSVEWVKYLPDKKYYEVLARIKDIGFYRLQTLFYFDQEKKIITDFMSISKEDKPQ